MSEFLDVARSLAVAAAATLTELSRSPLRKERKADHSLVTNADFAADRIIRHGLQQAFPTHAILTEESGLHGPSDAEFVWVVDPLDGTRAYAKAVAGYSVMIGLLRKSEPYAGVVADPWEGHLYWAQKGQGAHHAFLPQFPSEPESTLRVSVRSEYAAMPIITSTGFPEPMAKTLRERLPSPWLTPINSVGIKVGLVVRQKADIYLNHHRVHYWDTCAPQVILEEAGGRFSFFDGQSLTYDLSSAFHHALPTLATNNTRHEDLQRVLSGLM